jgi:hypothetical protein
MAQQPEPPATIFAETLELPDGRTVRVRAYQNGEVRIRVDRCPYVISEAYLSGGPHDHAIIKLSPGKQGSAAYGSRVDAPAIPETAES